MIAILDYGAGNLTSVLLAFKHLGANVKIAHTSREAEDCTHIVFPGVGSAASGMKGLCSRDFHTLLLEKADRGVPVLAICLGMQMLLEHSAEDGGVQGLGMFPGAVLPFDFPQNVKVPHIGWNQVRQNVSHPLFDGIKDGEAFYFVHSFYAAPKLAQHSACTTEYAGFNFTSSIAKDTVFATQFHPERSGANGLKLLENFTRWKP